MEPDYEQFCKLRMV